MTIAAIDVNAMLCIRDKIKNRQGKSIEDLPVAKVANAFITVVTELRSATPNAAGIWINSVFNDFHQFIHQQW
ncbi:hypothetical protein ACLBOM_23395 [Escherichia coli]